jgi:hypothetical protein
MNRIQANKRVSRRRLARDINVPQNLQGLLERGVQVDIDREEKMDEAQFPMVEAMLGYTGSVGTALWYEIEEDRSKVRCRLGRSSFYHRLTRLVVRGRDGG